MNQLREIKKAKPLLRSNRTLIELARPYLCALADFCSCTSIFRESKGTEMNESIKKCEDRDDYADAMSNESPLDTSLRHAVRRVLKQSPMVETGDCESIGMA
jgi:hypothetical protein